MILKLMSWGLIFLAAVVQSAVTSARMCYYASADTSCSGAAVSCTEVCDLEDITFECAHATCKNVGFVAQEAGMTAVGECTTVSVGGMTLNAITTCEEDGVPACASDDIELCVSAWRSNSGVCSGESLITGVDLASLGVPNGLACEALLALVLLDPQYTFTEWCECFTFNNTYDMKVNCGQSPCSEGGSSGGSSNTGMIIGIVVGAVVLVIVIVAVVICMRRRKL